ncbi:MAG: hypothetical protein AAFQ32_18245 [Pseudomonadota bacterium]
MKQHIRAEDFSLIDDRMFVGGRVFQGNSILFAHVEKRTSLELLGFYLLIVCLTGLLVFEMTSISGALGLMALLSLLTLGAYRELARPYVIVMNIYQVGIFEVRGFTRTEAEVVEFALNELRGNTVSPAPSHQTHNMPGST